MTGWESSPGLDETLVGTGRLATKRGSSKLLKRKGKPTPPKGKPCFSRSRDRESKRKHIVPSPLAEPPLLSSPSSEDMASASLRSAFMEDATSDTDLLSVAQSSYSMFRAMPRRGRHRVAPARRSKKSGNVKWRGIIHECLKSASLEPPPAHSLKIYPCKPKTNRKFRKSILPTLIAHVKQRIILDEKVDAAKHRWERRSIVGSAMNADQLEASGIGTRRWNENIWLKRRGKSNDALMQELRLMKTWFEFIDADGSGEIGLDELEEPLISVGLARSQAECKELMDGKDEISFQEFVKIMKMSQRKDDDKNAMVRFFEALTTGKLGDLALPIPVLVTAYRRKMLYAANASRDPRKRSAGQAVMSALIRMRERNVVDEPDTPRTRGLQRLNSFAVASSASLRSNGTATAQKPLLEPKASFVRKASFRKKPDQIVPPARRILRRRRSNFHASINK